MKSLQEVSSINVFMYVFPQTNPTKITYPSLLLNIMWPVYITKFLVMQYPELLARFALLKSE